MGAVSSFHTTLIQPIIRSKGRPDIELKLNLAKIILIASAVLVGVRFGAAGVAMSVSAVSLITWLPLQVFVNRFIGLSTKDFLVSLRPAVLGCVVMAFALLLFRHAAAQLLTLADAGFLALSVVSGAITYFVTLKISKVRALDEMIQLVVEMVRPIVRSITARIPPFKRRKTTSLLTCHVEHVEKEEIL
jgi:hypothetical protein